jgi:hypothetical protein
VGAFVSEQTKDALWPTNDASYCLFEASISSINPRLETITSLSFSFRASSTEIEEQKKVFDLGKKCQIKETTL